MIQFWKFYLYVIIIVLLVLAGPWYLINTNPFSFWYILDHLLYYFTLMISSDWCAFADLAWYTCFSSATSNSSMAAFLHIDGGWNLLAGYSYHYFLDNRIFMLGALKLGHTSFFDGLNYFLELHLSMAEKALSLINYWNVVVPGSELFETLVSVKENILFIKNTISSADEWLSNVSLLYDFHVQCEQTVDLIRKMTDLIQRELILAGYPLVNKQIICMVDGKPYDPTDEKHHELVVLPRG